MLIIFMPMISKNQLFNMHLSRIFKTTSKFFSILQACIFFKSRLQVEEIFDIFYFLGFATLNCTYVLSTYKVKIIIFQASNIKVFLNTIWSICFKNIFTYFYYTKNSQNLYTKNDKLTLEQPII